MKKKIFLMKKRNYFNIFIVKNDNKLSVNSFYFFFFIKSIVI